MEYREAISILKTWRVTGDKEHEALDMAISALEKQEAKQEVKKSRCTYKPDCPWYDGSKCNSPNDHGYHECDYDRGIFPESYEELSKNSPKLDSGNGELISREDVINLLKRSRKDGDLVPWEGKMVFERIRMLPSAQPDLSGYSDRLWKAAYERGKEEAQRKKGHWIRHPEQRNIFNGKTIECSECHEKYTVQYVEDELFCRHCGADMREPEDIPMEYFESGGR